MKKLFSLFAVIFMAMSMWAANFSNGATFTLATSAGVNYAEATVSGINNVTALTSKESYFHANTSNATFTLDLFDGLIFKSGSTEASTRFYPKYGFYMGQNASTLAIEGTTLAANQEITIYYNVTGTTNDKIKVTNASGTIPNTEGKNVTQTCTVNVINAGQNVEITRNGQTIEITKIEIAEAPTDPVISAGNVVLNADATSGEIPYTISNPATGVNPTAVVTSGSWVSNVQVDATNGKITFSATENIVRAERTATITISYTGASDKVITVTQKGVAITEIVDVTGAMTWDFSGYTTDVTTDKNTEVILGNYVTLTTGNADALKGKQQYIVRDKYCWQGTDLIFHPTVAGVVEVNWSSTAGTNYRTLKINDGDYAVPEGDNSTSAAGGVITKAFVPANEDVVLTGWDYKNGAYSSNQIRIWSIKFTPAEDITLSFNANEMKTYSSAIPFHVDGADVYKAAVTHDEITLTKIASGDVPAGEGVILYSEEGTDNATISGIVSASALNENDLKATTTASKSVVEMPAETNNIYVLSADNLFRHYSGSAFVANRAYILRPAGEAEGPMRVSFATDEVTAVENVEAAKAVKFIENGTIYIRKNGQVYNVAGMLVK